MKKITICLLFVMVATQFGCKKFLQITPIDKLTGNNFYQSESDIESNIIDMYGQLFDKYVQTNTAGATGEFRSGEVIPSSNGNANRPTRYDVGLLGGHTRRIAFSGTTSGFQTIPITVVNDRLLLNAMGGTDPISNTTNVGRFANLQNWAEYYRVIQQANILVAKLTEGIPALTAEQTKAYIAEAKFIRCYCYFFMVRLYGDVVYYTEAYQKDPLPRENMVSVVNKCIADLTPAKGDLAPMVTNPAFKGVRASRGAAIGLLMNMNMWNAGFDPTNKIKYYQETKALGAEIRTLGFQLLNLADWNTVSKGRSDESLFELFSTINYNQSSSAFAQVFSLAPFGEAFIHFPYRLPEYDFRTSPCVFTADYMRKLYPDGVDDRLSTWFEDPFNQNAETFQLKKFAGNTFIEVGSSSQSGVPDNSFLIMRYSDAILLEAEACAELGGADEANAIARLNQIRDRARATAFPGGLNDAAIGLKDAIFWERAKELMGEGSHYFDLVRTKRILSRNYTDNPLTADKFGRGAWTWPISETALGSNPYMTLNAYWRGSGL